MKNFLEHIINVNVNAREGLKKLEFLPDGENRTLFVINGKNSVVGTITDGDIRRGLLNGQEISNGIEWFMNKKFKYLNEEDNYLKKIKEFRNLDIGLVPLLDNTQKIIKILDLKSTVTLIPASALIMAGGRGERLKPFTDTTPKSMLLVGDKPVIEHNIDSLIRYGITEIFISVNYLADQIINYFGDGSKKGITIHYIRENTPLGTMGALGLIDKISNEQLLVMNADLLTNIDFEDFFNFYLDSRSEMCIASIPYTVNVPYAVLQTENNRITSFIEKPSYTYYSSGGIYFLKSKLKEQIPVSNFYNATDLMQDLMTKNEHVSHYPMLNYWLDIGKPRDYMKAQEDIKHIKF